MSEYSMIFAEVQQGIQDLDNAGRQIAQQLEQLNQEAQKQLSSWSGQAQQTYYQKQQQWNQLAQNMSNISTQSSGVMQEILDVTHGTENSITNQWS